MTRNTDPFDPGSAARWNAFAVKVLALVNAIPRGRVMSYGDIAACVGGGPRMVARVMATQGDEAPWWRVLRADGSCAPGLKTRQRKLLRGEGVAFRDRDRVDMAAARYEPV